MTFADVVVETHRSGGSIEWGPKQIAIALLIVLGVIAIVTIVVKAMGWTIPDWLVKIIVVCAVVLVGILAINFLWSLF